MASGDATAIPVKNQAYRVTFPILDADGDLVTGAAGLDSEISKDGGTFADVTAEATEIATASGMYYLDLTATEMNADTVAIIVKTTTSGAKTTPIVLYPMDVSEPSQGAPPATPTPEQMLTYLYFMVRNKNEETSSEHSVYDNAGTTKLFKAAMTDNGTTLTKAEYVSGA